MQNTQSEVQKETLQYKCLHCNEGKLYEVKGEGENYLWCDTCLLSMDSDGGYTY